jgi:hypothetical protein
LKQLNRPPEFSLFFGPVKFASAQLPSSPPFLLPGAASPPADVATQCFIPALPLSSQNQVLNPHHHSNPPFPACPTPNFHCYKKIISIMITLSTTQQCLYFASSIAKISRLSELHLSSSFPFTVVLCPSSIHIITLMLIN